MYSTNINILNIFEDTCYVWNNAEHGFDVPYANFELRWKLKSFEW